MSSNARRRSGKKPIAVDLFCGAGGLTRGLLDAGIKVRAGYDIDESCRYAYEHNNAPAEFHAKNVVQLTAAEVKSHFKKGQPSILVGCAPCVTFSTYTHGHNRSRDPKWSLLRHFARIVEEVTPDVVSMENVPGVQKTLVFREFLRMLRSHGYHFDSSPSGRVVYCPDYGIPQNRRRLVLIASRLGPISLIPPTHKPKDYLRVQDVLKGLPSLRAGEVSDSDPMHRAASLSPLNLKRIRCSKPGGTWQSWPAELVASCHRKRNGKTFGSVYGRMVWDKPSPTITTQFHGFGNGRFGHPEQDRAISVREGALLQSFPLSYSFMVEADFSVQAVARMIGNAVPVALGAAIGRSITLHIAKHAR